MSLVDKVQYILSIFDVICHVFIISWFVVFWKLNDYKDILRTGFNNYSCCRWIASGLDVVDPGSNVALAMTLPGAAGLPESCDARIVIARQDGHPARCVLKRKQRFMFARKHRPGAMGLQKSR